MTSISGLPAVAHLLPEATVGRVTAIEPIAIGFSGAAVSAVSTAHGEFVLRVDPQGGNAARWANELRVLRRAAESGVAPPLVHVDEAARATVSLRVPGVPLATALGDPELRSLAIDSIAAQLRTLHAFDSTGIDERDPVAYARFLFTRQRTRTGFPAWATELEPIFDALDATLADDPRSVVSHNDPNAANVLWDGTRAWLIDWEVAGLTHRFYDLAVLALTLQLDDATAYRLLAREAEGSIDDRARNIFEALRRIAKLLYGLLFASLTPDLTVLPASPPTLAAVYAERRAGTLRLQDPHGRATFSAALLRAGVA